MVKILEKLSEKLKKIRLKLLKCEKAENSKDKFRILSESQKVTHPNRISHYIMVTVVKKLKVLLNEQKHHLTTPLRGW